MDWKVFSEALLRDVLCWKGVSKVPISGIVWEEIIDRTLTGSGLESEWELGSHSPGCDIVSGDVSFSVKSGQIKGKKKPKLSISSFRTTQYKTLQEKLDFFDNKGKNFSHYLVIAREEGEGFFNYKVYVIGADIVSASKREWETKGYGWTTKDDGSGISMKIMKSMSDQVWIYIEESVLRKSDKVISLFELSIEPNSLGSTHKIVPKFGEYDEQKI